MTITNPVVNKIFVDLEAFREFCTTELSSSNEFYEWNPANLYNEKSWIWRAYMKSKSPRKDKPKFQKNYNSNYKKGKNA